MGHIAWIPATSTTTMNAFLYFALVGASMAFPQQVAFKGYGAPTLQRAPAHDSASIEHHRLGGNFAYSTAESHAFAEVRPEISVLTHPVAETTHTHIPAPIATHQPDPIVRTHFAPQPIFKNIPTFGTQEIHGPVRTHQTISQPLVHETRTHTVQEVSQNFAPPLHQTVAHPVAVERTHVEHGVAHVPAVAHHVTAAVAPVAVAAAAPVAVAAAPAVAAVGYAGNVGHAGYAGYAGHVAAAPVGYAGHAAIGHHY